jgi:hypothetical protein
MASTWVGALLHKSRQQGKSPFPYQAAFMINNPVRRALLKPARIVDKLGLRSLGQVLKPGGRLVFVEMFPDPDRLSVRELRDLVEPENFEFVEATGNRWEDVVRFRRVDT